MNPEDNTVLTESDTDELATFFDLLARFDAEDKARAEGLPPIGSFNV